MQNTTESPIGTSVWLYPITPNIYYTDTIATISLVILLVILNHNNSQRLVVMCKNSERSKQNQIKPFQNIIKPNLAMCP